MQNYKVYKSIDQTFISHSLLFSDRAESRPIDTILFVVLLKQSTSQNEYNVGIIQITVNKFVKMTFLNTERTAGNARQAVAPRWRQLSLRRHLEGALLLSIQLSILYRHCFVVLVVVFRDIHIFFKVYFSPLTYWVVGRT